MPTGCFQQLLEKKTHCFSFNIRTIDNFLKVESSYQTHLYAFYLKVIIFFVLFPISMVVEVVTTLGLKFGVMKTLISFKLIGW